MLSTLERRIVVVVLLLGVLLLAGVVVVLLRWAEIKAWLDAPEVLRVQAAALEVPMPGGAADDATRSACAQFGALRCGWTDRAPQQALEEVARELRDREVDVDVVLCDDPAVPLGPRDAELECGLRVPVLGEELWVFATDQTPTGAVPLTRTAVWFAWDALDMSWPLYERLAEQDPYPYPYDDPDAGEPQLAAPDDIEAVLPHRYAGVTGHCWGSLVEAEAPCVIWEAPVDVTDLPADEQVEALVRELVEAGFFVDAADPSWGGEPLTAHRFTVPGGWTGLEVAVRPEGDGLVARVMAL